MELTVCSRFEGHQSRPEHPEERLLGLKETSLEVECVPLPSNCPLFLLQKYYFIIMQIKVFNLHHGQVGILGGITSS